MYIKNFINIKWVEKETKVISLVHSFYLCQLRVSNIKLFRLIAVTELTVQTVEMILIGYIYGVPYDKLYISKIICQSLL